MNITRKFYIRPLLKLAIHLLNNNRLQPFVTLSFLPSTKFRFSNYKIYNRISEREYMDLSSVIKIVELEVPGYLAEKWDNTGLLVEPSNATCISTILFTNDLTEDVLKEAVTVKPDLIISYHPPIFSPIKSLKNSNWKDRIIIKCIENSIAVYSPHTSCDAVSDGVNDWLISCFDLSECHPIHPSFEPQGKYSHILDCTISSKTEVCEILKSVPDSEFYSISTNDGKQNVRVRANKKSLNDIVNLLSAVKDATISMTALDSLPITSCGMGRIGKLVQPLPLSMCVQLVKHHLKLDFIRFSQSASHSLEYAVSTIAVCAGSGSSVLKGVKADLYITGEMSHHDLLDANHQNVSIILCEHSNSERGYLAHLVEKLCPKLPGVKLILSSSDKDPIRIL